MKPITLHLAATIGIVLIASSALGVDRGSRDPSIQLFLRVCAIPYAHAELVEREIREFGFTEIHGADAEWYLDGAPGRVWAGTIHSKRYAIALHPETLCTVIAHDGDSTEIKAAVKSWLPPPDSGVSVRTEAMPSPEGLDTTLYELKGGNVQERWIVTTSTDPASPTKAMLSWSRL